MDQSGIQVSRWLRMLLPVLTVVFVWYAVSFFAQNKNVNDENRDETTILQDVLFTYCRNQDQNDTVELLTELEKVNEDAAIRWKKILDCWQESTNNMPLHYGSLPGGLTDSSALCLIVLGFQLNPDGSMQKELVGRLEVTLECAKKYPNAYILCTGGGTASGAPESTEADAMARWLIEHGIAEKRIIAENRSLTTSQNAIFSYQILTRDYPEITDTAIISSDYHIPWAMVLFQTQFLLGDHPLTVVSNAASRTGKELSSSTLLRYQLSGIREIAGLS